MAGALVSQGHTLKKLDTKTNQEIDCKYKNINTIHWQ